ncbi:MAG TPA: hypothetical protein DEO73_08160 [Pantoea sp.]|nr:hypothetical protein [Pantoea sp.]
MYLDTFRKKVMIVMYILTPESILKLIITNGIIGCEVKITIMRHFLTQSVMTRLQKQLVISLGIKLMITAHIIQ